MTFDQPPKGRFNLRRKKGIFCLEIGEWFDSLKEVCTVEPILKLLKNSELKVPYIHRDISTESEFCYYIKKWSQSKHKDYPILYLAFHGTSGSICIFNNDGKRLDYDIDNIFDKLKDKCKNRVIHIGSCSVLDIHGNKIRNYLKDSKATAISGYKNDINWINSTVLDLYYLSQLQGNSFTKSGLNAVKKRVLSNASKFCKEMNFCIKIK
ncbi:MAG: hypothetical protein GYA62_00690 [Bacteroidales bacterium]|nr:hypothetical protein [Bacteroidales bacterium]